MRFLLAFIPRRCPCCGRWGTFATVCSRRMNTAYADDSMNFLVSCLDCWEYSETLWKERWDEYYSGCL